MLFRSAKNEEIPEGWVVGRNVWTKEKQRSVVSEELRKERNLAISKRMKESFNIGDRVRKASEETIIQLLIKHEFDYRKVADSIGWKRIDGNNKYRLDRLTKEIQSSGVRG